MVFQKKDPSLSGVWEQLVSEVERKQLPVCVTIQGMKY